MRAFCRPLLFVVLVACAAPAPAADRIFRNAFEDPIDCVLTPTNPECPTFTIATPPITVAPGNAASTCYYFRTPNTAVRGIRRLESTITGNAWYIVVYATFQAGTNTPADRKPPGTVSDQDCGLEAANTNNTDARRIYQAHANVEALDMPADDGGGVPVAIEWQPNQPFFIQVVAPNVTPEPIQAQVTLGADALPVGTAYTRTDTYMTYRALFQVPASSSSSTSASCSVPPGVKFWHFTTHTHQYATLATIESTLPTVTTIVQSNDWNAPRIQEFPVAPFFTFDASSKLRYTCNYTNPQGFTINSGGDEFNDENCVAVTYFFPATRPLFCLDNTGPL